MNKKQGILIGALGGLIVGFVGKVVSHELQMRRFKKSLRYTIDECKDFYCDKDGIFIL